MVSGPFLACAGSYKNNSKPPGQACLNVAIDFAGAAAGGLSPKLGTSLSAPASFWMASAVALRLACYKAPPSREQVPGFCGAADTLFLHAKRAACQGNFHIGQGTASPELGTYRPGSDFYDLYVLSRLRAPVQCLRVSEPQFYFRRTPP